MRLHGPGAKILAFAVNIRKSVFDLPLQEGSFYHESACRLNFFFINKGAAVDGPRLEVDALAMALLAHHCFQEAHYKSLFASSRGRAMRCTLYQATAS